MAKQLKYLSRHLEQCVPLTGLGKIRMPVYVVYLADFVVVYHQFLLHWTGPYQKIYVPISRNLETNYYYSEGSEGLNLAQNYCSISSSDNLSLNVLTVHNESNMMNRSNNITYEFATNFTLRSNVSTYITIVLDGVMTTRGPSPFRKLQLSIILMVS